MKISVILPVYNEEHAIRSTLENLIARHHPDEVLVVDGGSSDRTAALASEWARVVASPKGRARQLNAGAREASGDLYLFLHADTRLPENGLEKIRETIRQGNSAGRFRMRFDENHWLLKTYSFYTRFHSFSYGDQGFFVTRRLFEEIGGYREDAPFEDIDFYKRMRRHAKSVIIRSSVVTSARRFSQMGLVRQKLINFVLVGLHGLGLDVRGLQKRLYPDVR